MQSFIFQVRHFPPPAVWSVIFQCCIFRSCIINAPLNQTQSCRPIENHRMGMEVQDNAQISDTSIYRNIDVSFPYRYVESYRIGHLNVDFYSASALLAMQSAVIARGIPSVCLSVCPSRSGIVSRRMMIRSCGFQRLVGQLCSFWRGKVYQLQQGL